MKLFYTLLICLIPFLSKAQTYVGVDVFPDKYGITIQSEIDTFDLILSLKTSLTNLDPTFKARFGVKLGSPEVHMVVYMPILNLSLKEFAYNSAFNIELRYRPNLFDLKNILTTTGVEFYKDQAYPYLTIAIQFR